MSVPPGFPSDVAAFACDLDGTLIGRDAILRRRTLGAIARSQAAGIPVLVATGRMFRSVKPYLETAGIAEPVVCYQGAAVVHPVGVDWLFHAPIALELARDAIAALEDAGYSPNVYVHDELYVSRHTAYSREYADFQRLPVREVGDLVEWLSDPPTKLVAVGEPSDLQVLRDRLGSLFKDDLFVTTSLPTLLEIGHREVSKGSGLRFVADLLELETSRIVAFGDGENDVELLEEAGFGIAIEGGNPELIERADATCPGPVEEGVAAMIDGYLDSLG